MNKGFYDGARRCRGKREGWVRRIEMLDAQQDNTKAETESGRHGRVEVSCDFLQTGATSRAPKREPPCFAPATSIPNSPRLTLLRRAVPHRDERQGAPIRKAVASEHCADFRVPGSLGSMLRRGASWLMAEASTKTMSGVRAGPWPCCALMRCSTSRIRGERP
jgi:hypothetical protein